MIPLPLLSKKIRASALPVLLLLALAAAGCLPDLARQQPLDLVRFPQNPAAYLHPAAASQPLISPERQQQLAADFLARFFSPWHTTTPLATTEHPFWAIDWLQAITPYGANLLPVPPDRLQELARQAAPETYPSLDCKAITTARCVLRALPSRSPLFKNPGRAGEGFPFDYLQQGALPANTPLHVTHLTLDRTWAFVETELLYGWMPVTDLAWVAEDLVLSFLTGRYLVLTRDRTAVFDVGGIFRFSAGIGTLFPLLGENPDGYRVLLAVADKDRRAVAAEATIPFGAGHPLPLPLTARQLAELAGRMIGEPYGWGEAFEGRDCSATLRDLFAPFGLWLPRNSARQAEIGRVIPLAELPPAQREERLLATGVPFLTLVSLPRHIMLYLGAYRGEPALFHTL
ncbi:MAG: SH3 domain-containing protein [Deltaproteobacteria bacterium]|nr:SH3 domain-containing protein [Deltaproteobacteria bacterium]